MKASKLELKLRPVLFPLALGLAWGVTGCGGDDNGRLVGDSNVVPDDSIVNCDLVATVDETLMLRGDFEDTSASNWQFETDKSQNADLVCPQDSRKACSVTEPDETLMIDASGSAPYTGVYGAVGSEPAPPPPDCVTGKRGLHVRASGLSDWGGKLVRKFADDKPLMYFDASAYDGVSFWARTYSENLGRSLFIAFDDEYTKEDAHKDADANGVMKSFCFDSTIDTEKCDRFGVGIGLETSWRYYKIPFEVMQQRGYGVKSDRLHTEKLLGFGMGYDVGDWDFWVDKVSFYKEKE